MNFRFGFHVVGLLNKKHIILCDFQKNQKKGAFFKYFHITNIYLSNFARYLLAFKALYSVFLL